MSKYFQDKTGKKSNLFAKEERNSEKLNKEDFLIKQIDDFKEKAKQLQTLLTTRESKLKELQSEVNEKEEKANKLKKIVDERQQEADKLTKGVEGQVEILTNKVTTQMQQIDEKVTNQIEALDEKVTGQIELLDEKMSGQTESLEGKTISQLAEIHKKLSVITNGVSGPTDEKNAGFNELLEDIKGNLDTIREELSEKIHSENVKCYRNIQTLIDELADQIGESVEVERGVKTVKMFSGINIVVTVLNLLLLLGCVLYLAGII